MTHEEAANKVVLWDYQGGKIWVEIRPQRFVAVSDRRAGEVLCGVLSLVDWYNEAVKQTDSSLALK